MERRRFGASGLTVSAIGLGLAALGRPGYINLGHADDLAGRTEPAILEAHAHAMLDAARAAGITYFDAARSYGRAEEFLGHWMSDRRPPGAIVGSKWGYVYTADWQVDAEVHEEKIHTRDNLERQYQESLQLLGGHLTLYQIHSATLDSGVLDNRAILDRLAELRETGLIIGFSTSGPEQSAIVRRALEVVADGRLLFGAVQATWNLLETSADAALQEAADAGLAVIVKEAVANGRLTPHRPEHAERLGLAGTGYGIDAVAIAAALQRPWASVVLSGAATLEHLHANLAAVDVPSAMVERLPSITENPGNYWETRRSLSWG